MFHQLFSYFQILFFVWPGGKYCNGDGLAEPTGDCAPGWYCSGGAYTDKPTTYVNSTTLYSTNYSCPVYALNNTGGICEPGNQQFLSQLIHIIEFSTKLYLPKMAINVKTQIQDDLLWKLLAKASHWLIEYWVDSYIWPFYDQSKRNFNRIFISFYRILLSSRK